MSQRTTKPIKLALQGGGSHGAFTWGVLDRLLEDERLHIAAVSGTSAGAMNAVALAAGMARGGPAEARKCLEKFWSATSAAAQYSPVRRSLFDIFMGNWSLDASPSYIFMDHLSRVFSPYDLNPLNFNPLRDIVAASVDFDHVNDPGGLKLFLTATNVRTGRPKIFRQPAIRLDSVMASACLPFLFKAVEIDGEAYWDGGYMGNPALFPLVDECDAGDIVVIQINPFYRPDIPQSARDIQNRLNEITFNTSLLKELRSLAFLWESSTTRTSSVSASVTCTSTPSMTRKRCSRSACPASSMPNGRSLPTCGIAAEKPRRTGWRGITRTSAPAIR